MLKRKKTHIKYILQKQLSLIYYDVMILELELDFAQFVSGRGA